MRFGWDLRKAAANLRKQSGKSMKRAKPTPRDALRKEYKRSDFGSMKRGKYAARIAKGTNVVLLDPAVSKAFPDDQAVNDALRALIGVATAAARPISASKRPLRKRA